MKALDLGFRLAACAALLATAAALAQRPVLPGAGPVPSAIVAARKIFVSNAGADSGLFPSPFSGYPDRPYNQFYAALKADGRYQLVADPAQADLVLELQLIAPYGPTNGSKQYGASDPLPMFRLVVYDRPTHYILWTCTRSVELALLQKSHDRNFDDALTAIRLDFEGLAATPPAPGN